MKARVKLTGEIVTVFPGQHVGYADANGRHFYISELDFDIDQTDYTALRNQAAIAAMQGLLQGMDYERADTLGMGQQVAELCTYFADALIEELKK